MIALAAAPVPPSVEEISLVVFVFSPRVEPVTSTEKVHDAPAPSEPPVTAIVRVEAV